MDKPLISVIVPVYKTEKYLEKCANSILSQTYKNIELWLVDDGSPDRCPAMCDAFAQQDDRVTVIHKTNGGLSSARNAALDVCRGDYIMFVDSDDTIAPETCEVMLGKILESGADMCVAGIWSLDEEGNLIPNPDADKLHDEVIDREEAFRRMTEALDEHFTIVCGKLCKRELYRELRMPDGRIHEDLYIIHRLCGECSRIVTTRTEFYCALTRESGITHSPYHIKRMEDAAAAYWDRYLYLKEQGYPHYAKYALQYCCGTVNVGLQKLPLKGNEQYFYPHIKRLLTHYFNLRCVKMLLLVVKNRLTRWES